MDPAQTTMDYPKPPFPKQQQPWPGLCARMEPKPDHGETSYKGSGRLKGRKALITGGDSGIGRAVAIAFAREGADVAINYLPAEEPDAREVMDLVRAEKRKAVAIPGDIKDEQFCNRMVAEAVKELGGLDILVNNAGRQIARKSILEITTADFDETYKTNVYAMFWITKAAVPHMKPGSTIINTASINSYDPSPDMIDYASTKGAIMIFTKGLAKQLVKQGIRARAVLDGAAGDGGAAAGRCAGVREGNADGQARPARGARGHLRAPRLAGVELFHGPGLRGGRRARGTVVRQRPSTTRTLSSTWLASM